MVSVEFSPVRRMSLCTVSTLVDWPCSKIVPKARQPNGNRKWQEMRYLMNLHSGFTDIGLRLRKAVPLHVAQLIEYTRIGPCDDLGHAIRETVTTGSHDVANSFTLTDFGIASRTTGQRWHGSFAESP